MPRAKRKVAKSAPKPSAENISNPVAGPKVRVVNPVNIIVHNAQSNEAFHTKYIKELQRHYAELGHDTFIGFYFRTLQQLMMKDDTQPFATAGLKFMAKFATSYGGEDAHPVLVCNFEFCLGTVSLQPHIRFRLCQFVNLLLNALSNEATLDDDLCDSIVKYMFERLKDVSATVRVQALTAMQRLQIPDNPSDPVVKIYQYHLNNDPSAMVRQAVITSIGRNIHTIPLILERFWDVDDKVRRHAYLHMCSYSVRSYKVAQRLTFLEQGLNDHSAMVRKVVVKVLLPSWLETYNKKYIDFVAALKLDANEQDIERFRKTAKMTLNELFKDHPIDDLIDALELHSEGEHTNCIPLEKLSVESILYWFSLAEFCSKDEERDGQLERILPELTTFCNYVTSYFLKTNEEQMDQWQKLEHHYIIMTLIEMMSLFDLADEIGRNNLKQLIRDMLTREEFDEHIVSKVIECLELLETNPDERLQFVADIIHKLVDVNHTDNGTINMTNPQVVELLDRNPNLKVKVSSIKLDIMELQEKEMNCIQNNDYMTAEKFKEQITECNEQFTQLITPYLNRANASTSLANSSIGQPKRMYNQEVLRCIQMAFFVVRSKNVKSLIPSMSILFKNFIRRQIEVNQMCIRGWALKCGISFSLLYEQLAADIYASLYLQFFKHQNPHIWAISISGMIELIDRYGFELFEEDSPGSENGDAEKQGPSDKLKKSRQLYNSADPQDTDDEEPKRNKKRNVMFVFDNFLQDCKEQYIHHALIDGYCRLLLHDHISGPKYLSKMMLKYFDPETEPDINQMLGIFFENLIKHHKQSSLQEAMFPTLFLVLEAQTDSPLQNIKPESIIKFVVNATMPNAGLPGFNIHDKIATSFLDTMSENMANKELLKLLAKEAMTLAVSDNPTMRNELKDGLDNLLNDEQMEPRIASHLKQFRLKLDGIVGSAKDGLDHTTDQMLEEASNADATQTNKSPKSPTDIKSPTSNKSPTNKKSLTLNKSPPTNKSPSSIRSPKSPAAVRKSTTPRSRTSNSKSPKSPETSLPDTPLRTPVHISLQRPATDDKTPSSAALNTTFGLDNTSMVRHLRKSMHPRQISGESDPDVTASPSKIRVNRPSKALQTTTDENNDKLVDEVIEVSPAAEVPTRKTRANLTITSNRPRRAVNTPSKLSQDLPAEAIRSKRKNDLVTKSPQSEEPTATVSKQNSKKPRASENASEPEPITKAVTSKPTSTRRTLEYTDTPLVPETTIGRRSSRFTTHSPVPPTSLPSARRSKSAKPTPSRSETPVRPGRRLSNATSGGSSSKENQHSTTTSPIQTNPIAGIRTDSANRSTGSPRQILTSPKILSPKSGENRRSSPPRKPTIATLIAKPRKRMISPKKINIMPEVKLKRANTVVSGTESMRSPPPKRPKVFQLKLHRIEPTKGAPAQIRKHTRNASVQEFMKNNIITRTRRSADQSTLLSLSRTERSTGLIGAARNSPAKSSTATLKSVATTNGAVSPLVKSTTASVGRKPASRIPTSISSSTTSRIPRLRNK